MSLDCVAFNALAASHRWRTIRDFFEDRNGVVDFELKVDHSEPWCMGTCGVDPAEALMLKEDGGLPFLNEPDSDANLVSKEMRSLFSVTRCLEALDMVKRAGTMEVLANLHFSAEEKAKIKSDWESHCERKNGRRPRPAEVEPPKFSADLVRELLGEMKSKQAEQAERVHEWLGEIKPAKKEETPPPPPPAKPEPEPSRQAVLGPSVLDPFRPGRILVNCGNCYGTGKPSRAVDYFTMLPMCHWCGGRGIVSIPA